MRPLISPPKRPKFEAWLTEIDQLAITDGYEGSYTKTTGADCWSDAFRMGETATSAWAYEKECAHQLGCF